MSFGDYSKIKVMRPQSQMCFSESRNLHNNSPNREQQDECVVSMPNSVQHNYQEQLNKTRIVQKSYNVDYSFNIRINNRRQTDSMQSMKKVVIEEKRYYLKESIPQTKGRVQYQYYKNFGNKVKDFQTKQHIASCLQQLPINQLVFDYICSPFLIKNCPIPTEISSQIEKIQQEIENLKKLSEQNFLQFCNAEAHKQNRFAQHNQNKNQATTIVDSYVPHLIQMHEQAKNLPINAYKSESLKIATQVKENQKIKAQEQMKQQTNLEKQSKKIIANPAKENQEQNIKDTINKQNEDKNNNKPVNNKNSDSISPPNQVTSSQIRKFIDEISPLNPDVTPSYAVPPSNSNKNQNVVSEPKNTWIDEDIVNNNLGKKKFIAQTSPVCVDISDDLISPDLINEQISQQQQELQPDSTHNISEQDTGNLDAAAFHDGIRIDSVQKSSDNNNSSEKENQTIKPKLMQLHQKFNALEHFENYTYFQLRIALRQHGKLYKTRQQAIYFLQQQYKDTGKLPQVNLSNYQMTSPKTLKEREDDIKDYIQRTNWYLLIIQFVPLDVNQLYYQMKSHVSINKQFLEDFLVRNGVLIAKYEEQVGEQEQINKSYKKTENKKVESNGKYKQLTLSENLRLKK